MTTRQSSADPTLGIALTDLLRAEHQTAIPVRPDTWTSSKYPNVRSIGIFPSSIVRSDLAATAADLDWDDDTDVLRLFVLTMMWGSGTRNGRGPRNTEAAVGALDVLGVLRGARTLLSTGDIAAAYRLHRRIPGVGPAFFTKWLWVVGSGVGASPTPLILDSLVWTALGSIGWNSEEAAGSRDWGDRYVAYLRACERWAELAGGSHTAEDAEYTLFTRGKALGQTKRRE